MRVIPAALSSSGRQRPIAHPLGKPVDAHPACASRVAASPVRSRSRPTGAAAGPPARSGRRAAARSCLGDQVPIEIVAVGRPDPIVEPRRPGSCTRTCAGDSHDGDASRAPSCSPGRPRRRFPSRPPRDRAQARTRPRSWLPGTITTVRSGPSRAPIGAAPARRPAPGAVGRARARRRAAPAGRLVECVCSSRSQRERPAQHVDRRCAARDAGRRRSACARRRTIEPRR